MPGQGELHRQRVAQGRRNRIAVHIASRDADCLLKAAAHREIEGIVRVVVHRLTVERDGSIVMTYCRGPIPVDLREAGVAQ